MSLGAGVALSRELWLRVGAESSGYGWICMQYQAAARAYHNVSRRRDSSA